MEMTIEKLLDYMKMFKQCYDNQVKEAERELRRKREQAIGIWVDQNAKYKIGDILKSFDNIIKVDKIKGYIRIDGKPAILYHGPVLTKKLQPRKDGSRTTIFDDNREIILVKKKEE